MIFKTDTIKTEEIDSINNFFAQYGDEFQAVKTIEPETQEENTVTKYLQSLVITQYQKSIDEIENTKLGNKLKRKRSLQQVMQESFFYGANRFGNNFIA